LTKCFYCPSAKSLRLIREDDDARRERRLCLRARKRGRRRRERRGFGNEYRGIDGLRQLGGNAR
jgi:hypothetical protein